MSSDNKKKIWKKPEITSFAGVEEAIAYYSERGSPEQVASIKRLFTEAEREREEAGGLLASHRNRQVNNQQFGGLTAAPLTIDDRYRLDVARKSRVARKHRAQVFGPGISRELPWDILLVLYTNHDARLTISSVQNDVGAPMTTVLRWLQLLEDKQYIIRHRHPSDRRIVYVELSSEGRQTLNFYFEAILAVESTGF